MSHKNISPSLYNTQHKSFQSESRNSYIPDEKKENIFSYINITSSLIKSDSNVILKPPIEEFIYSNHLSFQNTSQTTITQPAWISLGISRTDLQFESVNHLIYSLYDIFTFESILGKGSFGLVIKAKAIIDNSIGHRFEYIDIDESKSKSIDLYRALKIIQVTSEVDTINIKREAELIVGINNEIHKQGDSSRIVNIYSLYENKKYIVIEMEYINGPTLKDLIIYRYISNDDYLFTEKEVSEIIKGLLEGLSLLHLNHIIHRDLKPENIMFNSTSNLSSLKIIDLGLFTKIEDTSNLLFNDKCGTLLYMAPEMAYTNKPIYNESVDIWSCGIIFYILISGSHPIINPSFYVNETDFIRVLKQRQVNWRDFFSSTKTLSEIGKNLLNRLCNWNKFQRIDCFLALKHPFITRSSEGMIPVSFNEKCVFEERMNRFRIVSNIYSYMCLVIM